MLDITRAPSTSLTTTSPLPSSPPLATLTSPSSLTPPCWISSATPVLPQSLVRASYNRKMLATTTTMMFNLPLVLSLCSFINLTFFPFLFPTNSGREPRNHFHQSHPLHVCNKTPLVLVSAAVRWFLATVCRRHPLRNSIYDHLIVNRLHPQ